MAIAKICVYSRDSYKLFEKCLDIVDIRPWNSDKLRLEFINGTKFGLGMFKVNSVQFCFSLTKRQIQCFLGSTHTYRTHLTPNHKDDIPTIFSVFVLMG